MNVLNISRGTNINIGEEGAQGPDGSKGSKGEKGEIGLKGDTGSKGDASVLSLGAFSNTDNANGQTLTGTTLNMNSASATNGGGVNTIAQTFEGEKTFNQDINLASGKALQINNTNVLHNSGAASIFVGAEAGDTHTDGEYNTAIGSAAMYTSNLAYGCIAIGADALKTTDGAVQNIAIGHSAMSQATVTGGSNIAIGSGALIGLTSGLGNIVLSGPMAQLTTGSNNVILGATGTAFASSESNNILIGKENPGVVGDNNTIRIGKGPGFGGIPPPDRCFIQGIYDVTPAVSGTNMLTIINDQGQFGSVPIPESISVGAFGSSPNANGLTLTGNELQLEPATDTTPGAVSTGVQTFAGNKTFTGTITASGLTGTNTGDITVTTVGSSPNANGMTLSGQQLQLQPANGTYAGVLTTGTQTIAGAKTFSDSILLATTGGTPTALNFYEEYSASVNATGIWASGQSCEVRIIRIGSLVTLHCYKPGVAGVVNTANSAGVITVGSNVIPARFRPTATILMPTNNLDNNVNNTGRLEISTAGALQVKSVSGGNFSGTGSSGFGNFTCSYTIL